MLASPAAHPLCVSKTMTGTSAMRSCLISKTPAWRLYKDCQFILPDSCNKIRQIYKNEKVVQTDIPKIRTKPKKMFFGILAGLIAYMITGSLGLYLLKISWVDYAISNKDKSYTFEMLLTRLFIGIFASITAGISATRITNDKGKSAWLVGVITFCVAAYIHFVKVWTDYPVWYHFAYLLPMIPIIGLSHYFLSNGSRFNKIKNPHGTLRNFDRFWRVPK